MQALVWSQLSQQMQALVRKHQRHYGGDLEELLSEAYYHSALALALHDPARCPLSAWVGYYVQKQLLESSRKQAWRKQLAAQEEIDMGEVPARKLFDLHAFLTELSEDAQAIVKLTVGPHLHMLLKHKEKSKQPKPVQHKAALLQFLHSLGWSLTRIQETFAEIREALG